MTDETETVERPQDTREPEQPEDVEAPDEEEDEEDHPLKPEPVRPMDPEEFEVIRLFLGPEDGQPYPVRWLATALGYKSSRQIHRWINGEVDIPRCVAKHMRRWSEQGYVD